MRLSLSDGSHRVGGWLGSSKGSIYLLDFATGEVQSYLHADVTNLDARKNK